MQTDSTASIPPQLFNLPSLKTLLTLILLLLVWPIAQAGDPLTTNADRDLIMAAVGIGMAEEQRLQFAEEIAEFLQDYRSAMLRILRGHNATDLERKMEKKHQSLFRALDAEMTGMLTPTQFERYGTYRQQLELKLTQPPSTDTTEYLDREIPPANHH